VADGERKAYAALRAKVAGFDAGDGLPQALIHPDFVMANVIPSPSRSLVVVDWTGSGQGPRLWSLRVRPAMFQIWAVGQGRKSVAQAWRDVAEARELADAVAARALVAFGRGATS
jgi:aminoglycoside phosphotransferase (APT) family kinase protein